MFGKLQATGLFHSGKVEICRRCHAGLRSYPMRPFKLVFVYQVDGARKQLIGCAPFEVPVPHTQGRLRTVSFWSTPHSYLSQPLLQRDFAAEAIAAMWDWVEDAAPAIDLVVLPLVGVDSLTWDVVDRVPSARHATPLIRYGFPRPVLRRCGSFDEYLASLSAKRRKNYRRQWRALNRVAEVEVRQHRSLDEGSDWASQFM